MAIAKVQYKENASATPEVWMDTTQKTVTAGTMLSGTTALKNDGTGITGNIASKSSSDLTASGGTVTAPAGYYAEAASKSVASGSVGTPTATKGTVSNHSISVTPSVTNTTGYITGSTISGTAVTIDVTELESGTKSITANGTGISVSGYSLVDVSVGGSDDLKKLIERRITSIEWPDGITSIGPYAFYNCSSFNTNLLPNTITSIGVGAFQGCFALSITSIPAIAAINNYTFQGCSQLALSSLPNGVKTIGSYAFQQCTNITISSLPSSVTSIGQYAFQRCVSIPSISCDGNITSLGTYSFAGISVQPMSMTFVKFPNMNISTLSTTFGSTTAADACQQMEIADIGKTRAIGANAFANCNKLQTLVLRRTDAICTLNDVSALLNTPMRGYNSLTGTVYVPNDLISTYKTATNWSTLYSGGTVNFVAIEGSEYEL